MSVELAFDLLLMLVVMLVAYRAIHGADLFTGVVHYVGYGLLLSLVWVRLGAPDLALVEAAIGAGVTGALMLDAAGQFGESRSGHRNAKPVRREIWVLVAGGVAVILAGGMWTISDRSPSLALLVTSRLPESGAEHPVTAILLNFRGYDTWLEVGVLLVAALGVLTIHRAEWPAPGGDGSDRVLKGAAGVIAPFIVLVAGYLLWSGTHAPGGAFPAGSVLAATAILLTLAAVRVPGATAGPAVRIALSAAFVGFATVGMLALFRGFPFLRLPPETAGALILGLETMIVTSTAVTLALIFISTRRGPESRPLDVK